MISSFCKHATSALILLSIRSGIWSYTDRFHIGEFHVKLYQVCKIRFNSQNVSISRYDPLQLFLSIYWASRDLLMTTPLKDVLDSVQVLIRAPRFSLMSSANRKVAIGNPVDWRGTWRYEKSAAGMNTSQIQDFSCAFSEESTLEFPWIVPLSHSTADDTNGLNSASLENVKDLSHQFTSKSRALAFQNLAGNCYQVKMFTSTSAAREESVAGKGTASAHIEHVSPSVRI